MKAPLLQTLFLSTGLWLAGVVNAQDDLPRFTKELEELRKAHFEANENEVLRNWPTHSHARKMAVIAHFLEKRETLPELRVNTEPGLVDIQNLKISPEAPAFYHYQAPRQPEGFYWAFRLTTPEDAGPVYVASMLNEARLTPYLLAASDQEFYEHIRYAVVRRNVEIEERSEVRKSVVMSHYHGTPLKPQTEYLFIGYTAEPMEQELLISVNCFKKGYTAASFMDVFPVFFPEYTQPEVSE